MLSRRFQTALRRKPRVAIIHYWLVTMRGGERVLERLLHLFPQADIYTHVYEPQAVSDVIRAANVKTTFIQRMPRAAKNYKSYLPLMPFALEEIDLSGYDLVISSESGPAKGVIAPPDAAHICYCHSPMRYLWDQYAQYRKTAGTVGKMTMSTMFPSMRAWDLASAQRIDHIFANSNFIRSRVKRAWGRDASVLHPPVQVDRYVPTRDVRKEYLWVGQMTAYKRPDIAVEAFNRLGLPLLMVGDGEMLESLRGLAKPNIRFARWLNYGTLRQAYAQCQALIFTAEEDFGIVPVEANASGRPVIGYGRGGLLDTVLDEETGIFFGEQSADALVDAVDRFQHWQAHFDPVDAVMNARRFAPDMFDRGFMRKVIELRPDLSFEMPAAMEDAHLPLVIPRPEAQMAVPFAA
jgi:glycosyltransferase involved in cell wall biosynthesis